MGGNVTARNNLGHELRAERVNLNVFPRKEFVKTVKNMFKFLNFYFEKTYGYPIWYNEELIKNGKIFNGSTSYIMDESIPDSEIIKYKPTLGDIDVMVPKEIKSDLFEYLKNIESYHFPLEYNFKYFGSNKQKEQSIGNQINSLFKIYYNGEVFNVQVDFEFVDFVDDHPTEWATFSHSSSFLDAKNYIKAVNHKYLIRAIIGAQSIRDDIIVCTEKSTPDNFTITKSKIHQNPRMFKFSVDRGVRKAYEPLLKDGNQVYHEGKPVYRALNSKESEFIDDISCILQIAFKIPEKQCEYELELFNSFMGIVELMNLYMSDEEIKSVHDRYIELLWGYENDKGQELERGNPEDDLNVKMSAYKYFINQLSVNDKSNEFLYNYYKNYRTNLEEYPFHNEFVESLKY